MASWRWAQGAGRGPILQLASLPSFAPVLGTLQGVGPATASAVLQAADPSVPFLSEEAMQAVLGDKAYTGAASGCGPWRDARRPGRCPAACPHVSSHGPAPAARPIKQ